MYVKGRHEVYLMDRDNTVFCAADICFLARKRPGEHITDTLVDGVCTYVPTYAHGTLRKKTPPKKQGFKLVSHFVKSV